MANKYLSQNAGVLTEVEANDSSAGVGDAGEVVALDAAGKININQMPTGVAADVKNLVANGNIDIGDFVYVEAAGTAAVADNGSIGSRAVGFAKDAILDTIAGNIFFEGVISTYAGLTPGATYYLGVGGAIVLAAGLPTLAGEVVQKVGVALSTSELSVEIGQAVVLA